MAAGAFRIRIELKDHSFKRMRAPVFFTDLLRLVGNEHSKKFTQLYASTPLNNKTVLIKTEEDYNEYRNKAGSHGVTFNTQSTASKNNVSSESKSKRDQDKKRKGKVTTVENKKNKKVCVCSFCGNWLHPVLGISYPV